MTKINSNKAFYLTQLKSNKRTVLEDLVYVSTYNFLEYSYSNVEKRRGRVDTREYNVYYLNNECLYKRWSKSRMNTIIKVQSTRYNCKKIESKGTSYYVSNLNEDNYELTQAIRNHWAVEVMNRIRDDNFGEDNFKSKFTGIQKSISSIISQILNRLHLMNKTIILIS